MEWNSAEVGQVGEVAKAIAQHQVARRTQQAKAELSLVPAATEEWSEGLLPWPSRELDSLGYLPVRHLYRLLGFDENAPFRWRLEHKLIQALVLERFCPGAVPVTRGMFRELSPWPSTADRVRAALAPYYVKRTLGFGARPDSSFERTQAIECWLSRETASVPLDIINEEFVIQERLLIDEEYRVHTIEGAVVPDITYIRHAGRPIRVERDGPNRYVQELLDCLPDAFVSQTLCGWDVAQVGSGFRIVEVNFSGFHPSVCRGFQCSGFLAQQVWGPMVFAHLLCFVEAQYGVKVTCGEPVGGSPEVNAIYWWIARWLDFLRISQNLKSFASAMDEWVGWNEPIASQYRSAGVLRDVAARLRDTVGSVD